MEVTAESPAASWPNPPEWPLYVTIDRAAEIAGVGQATMRAWANDAVNPIPQIRAGRAKVLVRTAAIPAYAMGKELR